MSSHPVVALMQFAAIQLIRIGAADAVRQFAFVHDAIFMAIALNRVLPPDDIKVSTRHYALSHALSSSYDLLFHYGRAGATPYHGVANTKLVAWNDELHSFVNAEDIGGDEQINASLEREIRYGTGGAAKIQGIIDSHPPVYNRLNGCGPIRRSSSRIICVRRIVCNTATLATMPESTSSEDVFEHAARAWLRANDHCDRVIQDKLGIIVWEQDDWWRVSVLDAALRASGDRCAITSWRFNNTGRPTTLARPPSLHTATTPQDSSMHLKDTNSQV